jgi:uncharacterized protein YndB with AHSA1/START domain
VYFANGGTSGPLDEGKTVTWKFAEFTGPFPVHVKKVIKNEKIVLEWANTKTSKALFVEVSFEARQEFDAGQDQRVRLEREPGIS